MQDWLFDPFDKQYKPKQITEIKLVYYDNDLQRYIIKLRFSPLKGYPFTVKRVSSNQFLQEVNINVSPLLNQFRVDYEDIASQDYTGTGIVEFNANDLNESMEITYWYTGEYIRDLTFLDLNDTPNSYPSSIPINDYSICNVKSTLDGLQFTNLKTMFNASGNPPLYACRAWVQFDGLYNPPTIWGSGNVSSVEKLSSGRYRVYFSILMPNSNYSVVVTAGGNRYASCFEKTISYFSFTSQYGDLLLQDASILSALVVI